jgi:chorismate mutase
MSLRGIRGATTASANTRDAILDATCELLDALVRANDLRLDDIASMVFTMTPDLDAAFPAAAVRALGWLSVAALDAQAPRVVNDVPRCIRVLIHWDTAETRDLCHVYLRDAQALRPDRVCKSNV